MPIRLGYHTIFAGASKGCTRGLLWRLYQIRNYFVMCFGCFCFKHGLWVPKTRQESPWVSVASQKDGRSGVEEPRRVLRAV